MVDLMKTKISFLLTDIIEINDLVFPIATEKDKEFLSNLIYTATTENSRYVVLSFKEIELIRELAEFSFIRTEKAKIAFNNLINDLRYIYKNL